MTVDHQPQEEGQALEGSLPQNPVVDTRSLLKRMGIAASALLVAAIAGEAMTTPESSESQTDTPSLVSPEKAQALGIIAIESKIRSMKEESETPLSEDKLWELQRRVFALRNFCTSMKDSTDGEGVIDKVKAAAMQTFIQSKIPQQQVVSGQALRSGSPSKAAAIAEGLDLIQSGDREKLIEGMTKSDRIAIFGGFELDLQEISDALNTRILEAQKLSDDSSHLTVASSASGGQ